MSSDMSSSPARRVIVLGGDCTITLGVLAGLQRAEPDAGLVYFDGDADLGRPAGISASPAMTTGSSTPWASPTCSASPKRN
jgi:arginase family enzyme